MTITVLLGLWGATSAAGLLVAWRLSTVQQRQADLYTDFLRLHKELRTAQRAFGHDSLQLQQELQQQFIRAVCRQLQGIETALLQLNNRTETVTDWARWWAAALEQATRP